jgi:hypothetical protein
MAELTQQQKIDAYKAGVILNILTSAEELRDWLYTFYDIYMPMGHVYPESNSSPIEAMWEIYKAVCDNTGDKIPGYIILSSRDSYKTLSASMLEVLLMIHFRKTIAHCAAIESQSQKAVEYCDTFVNKVLPYLKEKGWNYTSANKRRIEFETPEKEKCYIQIIILTIKGANCISPDTNICLSNGDYILAKNVQVGDFVKTWNYFDNIDENVQVEDISYTSKPSRELIFDNGSNLVLSDDHMVFTQRGWVTAAGLRLTDKLKKYNDLIFKTEYAIASEISAQKRNIDQIIIGTVLGDAHIQKLPSGKCRYSVFHCKNQLEYLNEIKKVFDINGIESSIRSDKSGYKLLTKTHPIFEKYHHLFYEQDLYKNPTKVLDLLDFEGISYWFMDDVRGNSTKIGKFKDHRYQLATCGFKSPDNEIICKWFKNKGFNNIIKKITNQSKKYYEVHEFSLESSRSLSLIMEPFFVNCLRYKLQNQTDIINSYRCIDSDKLIHQPESVFGFQWEDKKLRNGSFGRSKIAKIKECCDLRISEIKIIGKQELIDLQIKSNKPHLHSFYANNALVHNSAHTNLKFTDEVDLCDPKAYEEAKMIPGVVNGQYPIEVQLSTRKYAFGLMELAIKNAPETGEKVLRWNILDVAAHCPSEICKPEESKALRYIPVKLPMSQITEEQFNLLDDSQKHLYEKIECYAGCTECKLLSVCKMMLHDKTPKESSGDLYKPVSAIINVIKKVSPDVGEAQLICHKPSTHGLIYPRFTTDNVISIEQAWQMIAGIENLTNFDLLLNYIRNLGVRIETGLDWGFTNQFAMVTGLVLPDGKCIILDTFAAPELELDDCVRIAQELKDKLFYQKIWPDPAYPANIKTFNRKGLKCGKFTKDVPMGIEAVRERIINSANRRNLFVINTDNNKRLIDGFGTYHWKMDAQGNPTDQPDHSAESDIMDAIRYLFQNIYGKKGKITLSQMGATNPQLSADNSTRMLDKIKQLATEDEKTSQNGGKKRFFIA